MFQRDEELIDNIHSDIETVHKGFNTEMDLVYEALEQLWEIMALENNGTTSKLVDFVRFCSDAKTFVGSSVIYSTSKLSEITLLPSTEPSAILSPSGESFVTLSVSSGSLIGLSAEATSTSSTILISLDSSTHTRIITEAKLDHSPAAMIPSPTESYISDESASSIEIGSSTLDVDDMVVTSVVDLSQDDENTFPWLNVRNLDECNVAEQQFKNYIEDVIITPYGHIKRDQEFFNLADFYRLREYNECVALIEEGKKSLDYFWTVLGLINNVTQGYSVDMKKLTSAVKNFQFLKSVDHFDTRLRQVCGGWFELIDEFRSSFRFVMDIGEARKKLSEANNTISEWRHILRNIAYENRFPTENIRQYLAKSITKRELAKQFLSIQSVTKRERYFQGVQNIDFLMQKYQTQIKDPLIDIIISYSEMATTMNDNNKQHLEFVQKLNTIESMGDVENTYRLYYEFKEVMEENIKKLEQNITNPLFDMLFKIKTIEINLREYNDSIKMDSHFYL